MYKFLLVPVNNYLQGSSTERTIEFENVGQIFEVTVNHEKQKLGYSNNIIQENVHLIAMSKLVQALFIYM